MKQMRFVFLEEAFGEPAIVLEPEVEEELAAWMAAAVLVVFKEGGIKEDDEAQ